MSEFTPRRSQEPGEPVDFNSNAISHEQMLQLRDQIPAENEQVTYPEDSRFDHLFNPDDTKTFNIEDAAVRPPKPAHEIIEQENEHRMAVIAAGRKLREKAGLPPQPYDLR